MNKIIISVERLVRTAFGIYEISFTSGGMIETNTSITTGDVF